MTVAQKFLEDWTKERLLDMAIEYEQFEKTGEMSSTSQLRVSTRNLMQMAGANSGAFLLWVEFFTKEVYRILLFKHSTFI